jgi:hypothetical protein
MPKKTQKRPAFALPQSICIETERTTSFIERSTLDAANKAGSWPVVNLEGGKKVQNRGEGGEVKTGRAV